MLSLIVVKCSYLRGCFLDMQFQKCGFQTLEIQVLDLASPVWLHAMAGKERGHEGLVLYFLGCFFLSNSRRRWRTWIPNAKKRVAIFPSPPYQNLAPTHRIAWLFWLERTPGGIWPILLLKNELRTEFGPGCWGLCPFWSRKPSRMEIPLFPLFQHLIALQWIDFWNWVCT